ncbi:Calcineurin subunit B type 1 [Balamuthia mandrillaris]
MGNGGSSQPSAEELANERGLSVAEVQALMDAFHASGNKRNKPIDLKHFKKVVAKVHEKHPNPALSPESAELAFSTFDADGNGKVDPFELLDGIAIIAYGTVEEKAEFTFKAIDKNGDGHITQAEFNEYIRKVVNTAGEAVKDEKKKEGLGLGARIVLKGAVRIIKEATSRGLLEKAFEADADGDGKITLEEFKAAAASGNSAIVSFLNPRQFVDTALDTFRTET